MSCAAASEPHHGLGSFSARAALRHLLAAGVRGTFDSFAKQAGVPERVASMTLGRLCYEGAAAVHGVQEGPRRVGRPRAIYGPPHHPAGLDALRFAQQVWR